VRCFAIACVIVAAACDGRTITGTSCADDSDCNLFNAQGRCEPTGWCSFADETCAGGQRYTAGAGDDLGGTCVGGAPTCGERDQACCGSGVCAANLVCATETATCECGGAGQPCCDGTTCEGGLRCGEGATCSTSDVLQVATGAGHACALFADHRVSCWGFDYKPFPSQAGIGDSVIASPRPAVIDGATDIVELRAAETHTCGKKSDSSLWCWGHNEWGQLGNGTTVHSRSAVRVTGLSNVTLFDGGRMHTCAVGSYNGTAGVWCWGRGGQRTHDATGATGRLGHNSSANSSVPVRVELAAATSAGQTIRSLSTGAYHSCVVTSDDKIWCWGSNASGELGIGNTTPSKVPVQTNLAGVALGAGVTVDEVSCSDGRHKKASTCLRLSSGVVHCWGSNERGELGDGTTSTTPRTAPTTAVSTSALGSAKIVQLASAQFAKCGRTDTGDVWCWGQNTNGIVGIDESNPSNRTTPVKTTVLTNATQLDMSHKLACAVDAGKQLYCWGTNRRGQAAARPPTAQSDKQVLQPTRVEL
jgi:alpha-tubulin suppressor-like RCC1 family protein